MSLVVIDEDSYQVIIELAYATAQNIAGRPVYTQAQCALHRDAAVALKRASEYAQMAGFTLKIFDAYRPQAAQDVFWSVLDDPRYVSDPSLGSNHTRGIAVDLTLVDHTGQSLDMGTGFDDMHDASHHLYPHHPPQVQQNRFLLLGVMQKAGFKPLATEWWHYELPDRHRYPLIPSHPLVTVAS
ncbi:MAG TPA: D-alanyl-D-alanine dipeptidase [Paenalcaligenes sp.]|nr:D-alanyl-D-alanine dipeptidase [Paenalcaligenes sp.]